MAGVAFDGVEREVQASGALEQSHALLSQVVDLLPALASALRQDLPVCRLAEQVPQVPAVPDLHEVGCRVGDGLGEAAAPSRHTTSNPACVRSQVATGSFARSASTSTRAPVAASMMIVA